MRILLYLHIISLLVIIFYSCKSDIKEYETINFTPPIFPEYGGVTVPQNIAPLNFYLTSATEKIEVRFHVNNGEKLTCNGKHAINIPLKKWKKLLESAIQNDSIVHIEVYKFLKNKWHKYNPTYIKVAEEIDPYIAYRLIEPGYVIWGFVGLYQRNITNFEISPIMENTLADKSCMNCHSFADYDPNKFIFHMRGSLGATMLINNDEIKKLDTQTSKTISTFTYPSWHPSGKYIAFSTNITGQFFHTFKEKQIEVFDEDSDIILYDVENNKIIKEPSLALSSSFETYPSWSPNGKTLYFCTADSIDMPAEYRQAKYAICKVDFNPENASFGAQIDTVYKWQGSCAFPRLSPDGKFLLFTKFDYGCFPIWHQEADLYMMDLQTKEEIKGEANSNQTDSYHSWSSNGRWVIFSSRRIDGLFTRLFISYVDENGKMNTPFLLPQKDFEIANPNLKSYNIPEFIKGKITVSPYALEKIGKNKAIQVNL